MPKTLITREGFNKVGRSRYSKGLLVTETIMSTKDKN